MSESTKPESMSEPRVSAAALEQMCIDILSAAAVPKHEAAIVARSLVRAEARGQASHGVMRLETYIKRVRRGLIRPGSQPEIVAETPTTVVIDAHDAFGHVVGLYAMEVCIERAQKLGLGAAAVSNSTHFGIACIFAERATTSGCIGIATSNAAPRMPPVGAKTAVLGTNPLAIAVPSGARTPAFVLDMSTSVAALGKILAARASGQPIPEGWALDAEGMPTTDAARAADGLILPMSGAKGFGLALVLEILSAALSGARPGQGAGSMYRTWDRSEGLGHFFMAVSVDAFQPLNDFGKAITDITDQIRHAERIGSSRVWLPGENEGAHERAAQRDGIALTPQLSAALSAAAETAGVSLSL